LYATSLICVLSFARLAVLLNEISLPTDATHPSLQNGKTLLLQIEHTNRPANASGWDTKYRIKQTSMTVKGKQGKVCAFYSALFFTLERTWCLTGSDPEDRLFVLITAASGR
jgi:hypothetical protein